MRTVPVHVKVKTKQKQEKKRIRRVICKIGLHVICLVLLSTILLLVHSYQIDRTEANAYISGYKAGCNKGFPEGYDLGNSHGYDLGYDMGTKMAVEEETPLSRLYSAVESMAAKRGVGVSSEYSAIVAKHMGKRLMERNQAHTQLLDTANEPFALSIWEWLSQKISKTGE